MRALLPLFASPDYQSTPAGRPWQVGRRYRSGPCPCPIRQGYGPGTRLCTRSGYRAAVSDRRESTGDGEGTMPGTVLLLAAAPAGKGCLVDAASVLPVLAAVPPGVLSGTDTANVVELADPLEPQAVLTRLRAAAAAAGPLTVFVTGQLQLDRRQRLPHLALARTTPSTVRYTALPWHWIREELRLRPTGATALVVDLHADAETWEHLHGAALHSGRNNDVYGLVPPRPSRRGV